MEIDGLRRRLKALAATVVFGSAVLSLGGCSLDPAPDPVLRGPADSAISFLLTARPDLLNTDGISSSAINVVVRDRDANPLGGRLVYFVLSGGGRLSSSFSITDSNGVGGTTYTAPNDGSAGEAIISARTVDNDFNQQIFRSVAIELRTPAP